MWTSNNKQIVIVINTQSIQHIQFDDGTQERGFNATRSFKRGIFVNPNLDKKKYLSLLKVFHPDVSNLDVKEATIIAQAIISAKDGTATVIDPKKTSDTSQSDPKASTNPNSQSVWQQYTWSDWTTSTRQNTQRARTRSRQQPKPPKPKKDFETWLSYVPTNYWNIFGNYDTFERDHSVDFRIFKRCYYGYFDTELEIVFRKGCVYREKITAIHRNCLHILERLNLSSLSKIDLWAVCDYEAIAYNRGERKADLVEDIFRHYCHQTVAPSPTPPCWSVVLTSPRPLWKHKFILSDYHHHFEQFNHKSDSQKHHTDSHTYQAQANTSDYFNCGQYLKRKKQWLERDQFLSFLRLARQIARSLGVTASLSDGYPAYPLQVLDLAIEKLSF
ncbi:MAG: hypothetical protein QNJ72_08400 [Pleurocapsa sp. MO_226.B13]|nr:hypothetical protein [Pleurocapsa sp. MO_226.B13]